MKIEPTGRGEILIRLDLDEAWAALEKESVGINPRLLEGVLRREDEMQVDMAEQAAAQRLRDRPFRWAYLDKPEGADDAEA